MKPGGNGTYFEFVCDFYRMFLDFLGSRSCRMGVRRATECALLTFLITSLQKIQNPTSFSRNAGITDFAEATNCGNKCSVHCAHKISQNAIDPYISKGKWEKHTPELVCIELVHTYHYNPLQAQGPHFSW